MDQNKNLTKLGNNKVDYSSKYDPTQLEAIERAPRRKDYKAPMTGYDIWTAFEVSFLQPNGIPEFFVIRIANPSSSKNIFESKSLKLYLNSFNNTICKDKDFVIQQIKHDLSKLTECEVSVVEVEEFKPVSDFYTYPVVCLEKMLECRNLKIADYKYSPLLLETMDNKVGGIYRCFNNIELYSDLLRSNCEITNQPDWARIYINYTPGEKLIEYKSLLKYIVSYRDHQEFHEPTAERIYNDLYELLQPKSLAVLCQYTRRGGIDINPLRSTDPIDLDIALNIPKLLQQ